MTVQTIEPSSPPEPPTNQGYAVRQGLLLLIRRADDPLNESMLGRVCDELKSDSRVSDFTRPPYRAHQARSDVMYPPLGRNNAEIGLRGGDHFHAVRFSDSLVFRLSVPTANQESFRGVNTFPPGDYFVAWDGITISVLWEQSTNQLPSRAAGRVAFDVIKAAATRAGLATYVQACSPGCQNRFTHVDAILAHMEDVVLDDPRAVAFRREEWISSPLEAVKKWHSSIRYAFFLFALYKNHARRIRDLIALTGYRLEDMLTLQQHHAEIAIARRRERLKMRWAMKGWRKKSNKAMADVWLATATIDVLRRSWDEDRRRFKTNRDRRALKPLFKRDWSDDAAAVDNYEPLLSTAALDNFSQRLSTRNVVLVTLVAGLAGLLGAIVGAAIAAS